MRSTFAQIDSRPGGFEANVVHAEQVLAQAVSGGTDLLTVDIELSLVRRQRGGSRWYGGFLNLDSHGSDVYFTMTQYDRYNVSLMHATLPADATNNAQGP